MKIKFLLNKKKNNKKTINNNSIFNYVNYKNQKTILKLTGGRI